MGKEQTSEEIQAGLYAAVESYYRYDQERTVQAMDPSMRRRRRQRLTPHSRTDGKVTWQMTKALPEDRKAKQRKKNKLAKASRKKNR